MTFDTSDILVDLNNILLDHGRAFQVKRQSVTEDSLGNVTDVSNTEGAVYGILQDITRKDRKIVDMGLAVPGNIKGYFKMTYSVVSAGVSTTFEIKEGDVLIDNKTSDDWRIEKILAERKQALKVLVLKNISNEGS